MTRTCNAERTLTGIFVAGAAKLKAQGTRDGEGDTPCYGMTTSTCFLSPGSTEKLAAISWPLCSTFRE